MGVWDAVLCGDVIVAVAVDTMRLVVAEVAVSVVKIESDAAG